MTTKVRKNTFHSWMLFLLAFGVTFACYWMVRHHVAWRRESPKKYYMLVGTTIAQAIAAASFLAL